MVKELENLPMVLGNHCKITFKEVMIKKCKANQGLSKIKWKSKSVKTLSNLILLTLVLRKSKIVFYSRRKLDKALIEDLLSL